MQTTAIKVKSCKEMGGATSVMPVISQLDDTIDWTVRCDWLQVLTCSLQILTFDFYLISFVVVVVGVLRSDHK